MNSKNLPEWCVSIASNSAEHRINCQHGWIRSTPSSPEQNSQQNSQQNSPQTEKQTTNRPATEILDANQSLGHISVTAAAVLYTVTRSTMDSKNKCKNDQTHTDTQQIINLLSAVKLAENTAEATSVMGVKMLAIKPWFMVCLTGAESERLVCCVGCPVPKRGLKKPHITTPTSLFWSPRGLLYFQPPGWLSCKWVWVWACERVCTVRLWLF